VATAAPTTPSRNQTLDTTGRRIFFLAAEPVLDLVDLVLVRVLALRLDPGLAAGRFFEALDVFLVVERDRPPLEEDDPRRLELDVDRPPFFSATWAPLTWVS
jgi:hypothetical protein